MFNDYKTVMNICRRNIYKGNKWFKFNKLFSNQGKQGIVGILDVNKDVDINLPKEMVFKISQDINYVIEHEYNIMQSLNDLSSFCPHFCKSFGILEELVEPKFKNIDNNPFNITSNYGINKKILLIEYIKDSYKLYNYIKSSDINESILYSLIKQVILSIAIAQNKKNFTHYDLHSCNIMIKKCDPNISFLYVIDSDSFLVPTYGYYPVIIDFGFSYVKEIENNPLFPSLGHTQAGFNSFKYDWISDSKLFLITVCDEIVTKRRSSTSKKFKRIVYNMFKELEVDWKSGWDCFEDESVSDFVGKLFKTYKTKSKLFENYEYYCIDIIQGLIILPLENSDYSNTEKAYTAFTKEWYKIEENISNVYYNIYILKRIVQSTRTLRPDYLDTKTRKKSVNNFKKDVLNSIDEVSKFCNPKHINYEVMLCSLYVLSTCLEGIFFKLTEKIVSKSNEQYKNIPFESITDIYCILEQNIPNENTLTNESKIIVLDSDKEMSDIFELNEMDKKNIDNANNVHALLKGEYINKLYKNKYDI